MTTKTTAAPSVVLMATLPVTLLSDGTLWVSIDAIASAVGGAPEFVRNRAPAHKVTFVRVSDDLPLAVEAAKALAFVVALRREQDEHSTKWRAYVEYRDAKKREAAEKRETVMREARESERSRLLHRQRALAERDAQRAADEAAQRAAERAAREGAPVTFEQWAG